MSARTVIYPSRSFAPLTRRELSSPEYKGSGRTQDWYRFETDINRIVATYQNAQDPALLMRPNGQKSLFQDLPDDIDFHSAMIKVSTAESTFNNLPSAVRERYGNSTLTFLQGLADPAEVDFLLEQGIFETRELPPYLRKKEAAPRPSNEPGDVTPA